MSYPQIHFTGPFSWLSPPPMGRILVLACYWAIVAYMLTYKAIISDAYYYERIGFRAGWISATQVPLVYLLASKSNVIGYLIGSSHERLNWLHRWVSRTLLISVTVHGAFFIREWVRADFLKLELAMMPMVKYGLGGWAILVWTFLSSLSPLRRMAYEVFVLQHIAAAVVFLWLLYVHVPAYARYNVWFAIAAICFDRFVRTALLVLNNIRLRVTNTCNRSQRIGHEVKLEAINNEITIITIKDVHLSWKAGQHIYLWLPWLGPLESHPFTIATPYKTPDECHCHEIQFAVKAQSGFSKRINKYATKNSTATGSSLTGFIAGPYGAPPSWQAYESLILISASTGASYMLPILEDILSRSTNTCTKRLSFLLTVRDRCHMQYYEGRLAKALAHAKAVGIELDIEIAVTGENSSIASSEDVTEKRDIKSGAVSTEKVALQEKTEEPCVLVKSVSASSASSQIDTIKVGACCAARDAPKPSACCCAEEVKPGAEAQIVFSYSRPDIPAFIRRTVEITGGETSVAVCGGKSLVAKVRNSVASLSDERAVHKGTGAQGIHLHVEEYCF
jgi:NAD(P)H-flavin reductase